MGSSQRRSAHNIMQMHLDPFPCPVWRIKALYAAFCTLSLLLETSSWLHLLIHIFSSVLLSFDLSYSFFQAERMPFICRVSHILDTHIVLLKNRAVQELHFPKAVHILNQVIHQVELRWIRVSHTMHIKQLAYYLQKVFKWPVGSAKYIVHVFLFFSNLFRYPSSCKFMEWAGVIGLLYYIPIAECTNAAIIRNVMFNDQ